MVKMIQFKKLFNNRKEKDEEIMIKYDFELLSSEERKKFLLIIDLKKLKFRKGKRTRCIPKKNDIFVIEIFDNFYIYGAVLNPKVDNEACLFFNKKPVLVIFDIVTIGLQFDKFIKTEKRVLVQPFVTFNAELNNGFIQITGNYEKHIDLDYGFYIEKCDFKTNKPMRTNEYYNEFGEKLKKPPKYSSTYRSIKTNFGILSSIYMGLILNKNILVIDGVDYNYILDELEKGG